MSLQACKIKDEAHDVVVDVDVLDGNVGERETKAERAGPPVVWEASQSRAVADHHEALGTKYRGKYIPPKASYRNSGRN